MSVVLVSINTTDASASYIAEQLSHLLRLASGKYLESTKAVKRDGYTIVRMESHRVDLWQLFERFFGAVRKNGTFELTEQILREFIGVGSADVAARARMCEQYDNERRH